VLDQDLEEDARLALDLLAEAEGIMDEAEAWFPSDTVIFQSYRDSVADFFQSIGLKLADVGQRRDSVNLSITSAGDSITVYNNGVEAKNAEISDFNTMVSESPNYCYVKLTSALAIIQSIPNMGPGDSLFIAADTFDLEINFSNSGAPDSPIVIVGDSAGGTVFTSGRRDPLLMDAVSHVEILNIVFSGSVESGVKLVNRSGPIMFKNCDFIGNKKHGIDVLDTDIRLLNCRFIGNGQSGIRVNSNESAVEERVSMENILVVRNADDGITGLTIQGEIINATVSDNGLTGIFLDVPERDVTIRNSIITFNGVYGVHRNIIPGSEGVLDLTGCNLYQNVMGELQSAAPYDTLPFLSIDPQYTDTAAYDYTPGPQIPDSLGFRPQ
jgi:hypothetical protein